MWFNKSLNVFGQYIQFDIHHVAATTGAKRGDFGGVWNNGNAESVSGEVEYGQAYAVNRD
jgi:hypothetical protein